MSSNLMSGFSNKTIRRVKIPAPIAVRQSLRTLDRAVTDYLTYADRPA